jgi:hypothetical protein
VAARHTLVARWLNAVAAAVLLAGAVWQAALGFGGHGWWRAAVAAGALWLGYEAVRVARYGPRIRR